MTDIKAILLESLSAHGHRGRIVSIDRLEILRQDIESKRHAGLLDEELYRSYLQGFVFSPAESLPQARSLIVVATENPITRFTFAWRGSKVPALVPPTYLHGKRMDEDIEGLLVEALAPGGRRVAKAIVPKKLLAVCSGLAEYGRNNIAYISEMGSFHRLAAFFSDISCPGDDWREPATMERCQKCTACRSACPTGAITKERFLLRAERCIVFHNEKSSDVPFPHWMKPSWHHCLVGCLICQQVCPVNGDVRRQIRDGAHFTEKETALLLKGIPEEELPSGTRQKLMEWDLVPLLDVLPRNLQVLLESSKA